MYSTSNYVWPAPQCAQMCIFISPVMKLLFFVGFLSFFGVVVAGGSVCWNNCAHLSVCLPVTSGFI